jgi:hypothetical protein
VSIGDVSAGFGYGQAPTTKGLAVTGPVTVLVSSTERCAAYVEVLMRPDTPAASARRAS